MSNKDEVSVNENSMDNKESDVNNITKGKDNKDIVSSGTSFEKPLDKKDIYSKTGDQGTWKEHKMALKVLNRF